MGDYLRESAASGNLEVVRSIMKDKGNPCSTDKYGLSPLMYAVWNGHSDCTKVLLANGGHGVSSDGTKGPSFNLVSVKGYSALHLSALDCPPWSAYEIAFDLLLFGVDRTLRCKEGLTAAEMAKIKENKPFLDALECFETLEKTNTLPVAHRVTIAPINLIPIGGGIGGTGGIGGGGGEFLMISDDPAPPIEEPGLQLQKKYDIIIAKHGFNHPPNRVLNIPDIENDISLYGNTEVINRKMKFMRSTILNNKNHFFAPEYLQNDRTTVSLPQGMSLYEHNLSTMALEGADMKGVKALNCLGFVSDQAEQNLERRKNILIATERSIAKNDPKNVLSAYEVIEEMVLLENKKKLEKLEGKTVGRDRKNVNEKEKEKEKVKEFGKVRGRAGLYPKHKVIEKEEKGYKGEMRSGKAENKSGKGDGIGENKGESKGENKEEKKANREVNEDEDIYDIDQSLVPPLPPTALSHTMPWDDDIIISADKRYLKEKKNMYV